MAFQPILEKLFSALQSGDGTTAAAILGNPDVQSDALLAPAPGPQSVVNFAEALRHAFDGPQLTLLRVIEDSSSAIAEFRFTGTHGSRFEYGPFHIEKTGRSLTMDGSMVVDFDDSQNMGRLRVYWNWHACLAQLGIRPHMRPDPVGGVVVSN